MSAKWTDDKIHYAFLDLCEDEIQKGNRPGSHFSKSGWANLEISFNERTGLGYTQRQLKNRWDAMKKDWVLFKNLMRGESGLGWDATRKTINADASWWAEKIAVNKEYKKFRNKDLSAIWFRYDAIFSDIAATGMRAQAITEINASDDQRSTDHVPYEDDDGPEDCNSNEDTHLSFEPPSLEKKRKANINKGKQVKQKLTGASNLRESICDLVDLMKSKSTATSAPPIERPTIQECLDILHGFPSYSLAAPVRYYASLKFAKKEIREIFMGQPNEEERIGFLQFLYDEKHK